MLFRFITDDPELHKSLEVITALSTEVNKLRTENRNKDNTIESLVEEKYTKYGDGYGFLATDAQGKVVWVNSVSIALKQKDDEIEELEKIIKN